MTAKRHWIAALAVALGLALAAGVTVALAAVSLPWDEHFETGWGAVTSVNGATRTQEASYCYDGTWCITTVSGSEGGGYLEATFPAGATYYFEYNGRCNKWWRWYVGLADYFNGAGLATEDGSCVYRQRGDYLFVPAGTWVITYTGHNNANIVRMDNWRLSYNTAPEEFESVLCDGTGFAQWSCWEGWEDGLAVVAIDYGGHDQLDRYPAARLYAGGAITTTFNIQQADIFTLTWTTASGKGYLKILNDLGQTVESWDWNPGHWEWLGRSDTIYLTRGEYQMVVEADAEMRIDDIALGCPGGDCSEYEWSTWPIGARIYYPLTATDDWGFYQTYSDTTWYGTTYSSYNIWRARPGAHAFAITDLLIDNVSVNQFGYVIDARTYDGNYWGITDTWIRYEGLATVNVSPGQLIGAQCDLGEVAYNDRLGQYHLILRTDFPAPGNPFNPVPYMFVRPQYGVCLPLGTQELPPGPGIVPTSPLEVCQACNAPTTWTNVGQWILWLECMIQNIYFCYVITWFNMLAGIDVLTLGRLVDMGPWIGGLYNNGLSWLGGFLIGGVSYSSAVYSDLSSRLDNLGYIIMSYAGGTTVYITQQPGTNFWDVLVGLIQLQQGLIELLTALITGLFDLVLALIDLFGSLVQLAVLILAGAINGLSGTQGSDLLAGSTGLDTVDCTQTGVWAVAGPSAGKAVCYFLTGLQLLDVVLIETPLAYLPTIIIGVLALGLVYWVMSQFKEIMAT